MTDSIFQEVALTPHIFQKDILLEDERKFERLLNILDILAESGQIVGVYSDWFRFVNEKISQFDDFDKDEIKEVLKYLNDRQRIVHIPDTKCNDKSESCWIKQALAFSTIRAFEIILATEQKENVKSLNEIDRKAQRSIRNKGAKVLPQTQENMRNLLAPVLAYAEIVKIYDPYFDLTKPRYSNAANIICSILGYRHGDRVSSILEIHTSVKILLDKNNMIDWKKLNIFAKNVLDFENEFNHIISIYIWEDKKRNDEWHDRWIVTNQCALTLGKGSDVSEWTDATWGLLDYDDIPNIEKKFIVNRGKYNLIAVVNSKGCRKVNKSNSYKEPYSEEERQAKLNNIKKLKPRLVPKNN